jgi:predicted aspartyl protease
MTNGRLLGQRFPYLPVSIDVHQRVANVDALLDTGFDGDVAVPDGLVTNGQAPDGHSRWTLADGSAVLVPYYLGTVELDGHGPFQAVIIVLGDEPLIGASAARHVTIILDHGQRVIVQP